MHSPYCLLLLLLPIFLSCGSGDKSQPQGWIFDISDYVDEITPRFQGQKASKRVEINGESEEKEITLDIRRDLGPLIRSDVNLLSLMDRYDCDTIQLSQDTVRIIHTARDSRLRTKKIEVIEAKGAVSRINVENSYISLISSSEELIQWIPDSGFTMSKTDQSMFREPFELNIKIRTR